MGLGLGLGLVSGLGVGVGLHRSVKSSAMMLPTAHVSMGAE